MQVGDEEPRQEAAMSCQAGWQLLQPCLHERPCCSIVGIQLFSALLSDLLGPDLDAACPQQGDRELGAQQAAVPPWQLRHSRPHLAPWRAGPAACGRQLWGVEQQWLVAVVFAIIYSIAI